MSNTTIDEATAAAHISATANSLVTSATLGLQWQWHANPQDYWAYLNPAAGYLRLYSVPVPTDYKNFWQVPNLLLQKLPAEVFTEWVRTPERLHEVRGHLVSNGIG